VIFVDSTVWIDYFRGRDTTQTNTLDKLFGSGQLIIGDLVLTEVLQGFLLEEQFTEGLTLFNTLHIVRLGGYQVSVQAARNFRILRGYGFTIRKTIDSLIATRCLLSGYELLHNDRDFIPFEKHLGLKCVI